MNRYLVDGILAESQSAVIAGAPKTMKTSIAVDLAISLANGTPFLSRFKVNEPQRVLFLSAESGKASLKETAKRVATSKGLCLSAMEAIYWNFWVPRVREEQHLTVLDHQIDESKAKVVILDPLYLMLEGTHQASVSDNGQQLQTLCGRFLAGGVTPVLVDHVKRSSLNSSTFKPLELLDITGAGKAEYFRQWMLIGRREKFNPEKRVHRLWLTVGGSAGHCGLHELAIDESRSEDNQRSWLVNFKCEPDSVVRKMNEYSRKLSNPFDHRNGVGT
ncbi:AAA family ATPase [Rubripirellula amarantea]|uniref:AAA family ATPase n=1 Tax=Rubripirellula amarantea TaxID=2527999 RepID=UPI0013EF3653|nr:AAA family ATPase [Rubripirellula amarantea]